MCSDDTDSFTLLYHLRGGEVATVALHTYTVTAFAGEHRADFHFVDACSFNGRSDGFGDFFATVHEDVSVFGMCDVVNRHATEDTFCERRNDFFTILQRSANKSAECTAVFFVDDDIVRNVDKTASEVTCVGRLQSGIRKTLTRTVGGDEVLQHGHTFLKVRKDGVFNSGTGVSTSLLRFCHQTTHTGKLGNLIGTTTRTRVEHHEHSIETLVGFGHLLHEGALDVAVHLCPGVDDLVVTFVVGDETHTIVTHDLFDAIITGFDDFGFFLRNDDIVEVERQTTFVCFAITEVLDAIEEFASASHTNAFDDLGDDVAE